MAAKTNAVQVTVVTMTLVATTAMHPFEVTPRIPPQWKYTWQVSVSILQGFPRTI